MLFASRVMSVVSFQSILKVSHLYSHCINMKKVKYIHIAQINLSKEVLIKFFDPDVFAAVKTKHL